MTPVSRIAVIGQGSSGIAAAKTLHQRGIDFVAYEASDRVGGNWVFGNRNGMSSAYSTLHINTSRERMEYPDFPMPKSYPDFPHHSQIAAYFDDYVDHFGFRDRIRFETPVRAGAPGRRTAGTSTASATTRSSSPTATTGTRAGPSRPSRGPTRSPASRSTPTTTATRSSCAARTSSCSGWATRRWTSPSTRPTTPRSTVLAARRGAHVVPKYMFGRPADQLGATTRASRSRSGARSSAASSRPTWGTWSATACPSPTTASARRTRRSPSRILDRLAHGAITAKPNIARLDGDRVHFTDGTSVHADLVVYCTGYKVTFPFFDPGLISAPDNDLPLFRRVFHPDLAGVYFVGAAAAARRDHAARRRAVGVDRRPPRPAATRCPAGPPCWRTWSASARRMFKRYVASQRHTMQVDFDDYLHALAKERAAGAQRAAVAA